MRQTVHTRKEDCTGCGACVSICPKGAIAMKPDEEGFLYPAVDEKLCVGCDVCEKRCPAGAIPKEKKPHIVGAQVRDEALRRASSSGGVFTALARQTLARGGAVFGAAFDENMHVEHIGAIDEAEIGMMRGSKYVQSDAADAIANAAGLLARGIPVMFSGTPCQIAGLLAKVGGKYGELLLTVDFVCHGVPSPGVFESYIKALEKDAGKRVTGYTFRDKRLGWKNFSAVATFEDGSEHAGTQTTDPYLYGFLQNLYLRPSCVHCDALRGNHHAADITLADLWGAQEICPERDDDTGLSLVMINTQRGREAMKAIDNRVTTFPVKDVKPLLRFNPSIEKPASAHEKRAAFFKYYAKNGFDGAHVMKLLSGPGKAERMLKRAAHLPAGAMRRIRALIKK